MTVKVERVYFVLGRNHVGDVKMIQNVYVRLIARGITEKNVSVTSSPFHYLLAPFVNSELSLFRGCIARECGVKERDVILSLEEPKENEIHWHSAVGVIINFHADIEQMASGVTDACNFIHMLTSALVQLRALKFVVLVSCGKDNSSCSKYEP